MKITELIEKLEQLKAEHGDLDVCVGDSEYGPCEVAVVEHATDRRWVESEHGMLSVPVSDMILLT